MGWRRDDLRGDRRARSRRIDLINPWKFGFTIAVKRTIRGVPRSEWDSCFHGDPEGWSYYAALEQSELEDFSWTYFVVYEHGNVVAVAPAFVTDYRLDTPVQGAWKKALQPVLRRLKKALTLRMLCLGSPLTDKCHIGFGPNLAHERRGEILSQLIVGVKAFAARHHLGLIAIKDIADADLGHGVGTAFVAAGFARQQSLPNTILAVPPGGETGYFKSLSHAARRDVRRKLKIADLVRIERRRGIEALDFAPTMFKLYEGQRDRSRIDFDQFEKLTIEYFRQVLIELGDAAVIFLYFHEDRLIAFNLCFQTNGLLIDKFIGFKRPLARALNLYVLSWMTNVRYCIEYGIPSLQTGQTAYSMKLHLGSKLIGNWNYFHHRNPLVNAVLRLAGPLLAPDRYDAELANTFKSKA